MGIASIPSLLMLLLLLLLSSVPVAMGLDNWDADTFNRSSRAAAAASSSIAAVDTASAHDNTLGPGGDAPRRTKWYSEMW